MKRIRMSLFFFLFFACMSMAKASAQILIVPNCLLSNQFQFEKLAESQKIWLIRTSELEKLQVVVSKKPRQCRGFMNVTAMWQSKENAKHPNAFLNKYIPQSGLSDLMHSNRIHHQEKVNRLLGAINPNFLKLQLEKLGSFPDRSANSKSGIETAHWLKKKLNTLRLASKRQDVTMEIVPTLGAKQPSLILKIGQVTGEPVVVIGSPMDTLPKGKTQRFTRVDDDASGAATLLEIARLLLMSDERFQKSIYLIWYAAQEEGKLGSQSVVRYFNKNKIPVFAVLQLDMTGYVGKEAGIGLTDDLTDAGLTAFVADLINVYIKKPVGAVRCGFACSDHVSWYQNGNRVAYPFETMDDEGNPFLHTSRDTLDRLSIEHISDFVRLGVAFAVELAEPSSD